MAAGCHPLEHISALASALHPLCYLPPPDDRGGELPFSSQLNDRLPFDHDSMLAQCPQEENCLPRNGNQMQTRTQLQCIRFPGCVHTTAWFVAAASVNCANLPF